MTEFLKPAPDGADIKARVAANGLELAYEQFGRDRDPALLLIMGLGTQLTAWPDAFCRALADTGLRVIRFDNRDIGLSTKMRDVGDYDSPRLAFFKAMVGQPVKAPYTLEDMAADTVGLMDALGIGAAHVVGASMGGMIAQLLAARYPQRVLTLTSIMSTSGARGLPGGRLKVLLRLAKAPKDNDPDTIAHHMATTMRMIGSTDDYARSHKEWASEIKRNIQRSYYPAGTQRQMLAIMAASSRVDLLGGIQQPALVIHGSADPLLPVANGRDTARHLPNARYEEIAGMGHDLPSCLLPRFVELISALAHGEQDKAA